MSKSVQCPKDFSILVVWDESKAYIRPYGLYGDAAKDAEQVLPVMNFPNCKFAFTYDEKFQTCSVIAVDVNDTKYKGRVIYFTHSDKYQNSCATLYLEDGEENHKEVKLDANDWDDRTTSFYECERLTREYIARERARNKYGFRTEVLNAIRGSVVSANMAEIDGNIWIGVPLYLEGELIDTRNKLRNLTFGRWQPDALHRHDDSRMEYHRWLAQFTDEEKIGEDGGSRINHRAINLAVNDDAACVIYIKDEGCGVVTSDPVFCEVISSNASKRFKMFLNVIENYLNSNARDYLKGIMRIEQAAVIAFDTIYVYGEFIRLDTSNCTFKHEMQQ